MGRSSNQGVKCKVGLLVQRHSKIMLRFVKNTKFGILIKYFIKNILRFGATQNLDRVAVILDFKMADLNNIIFQFYN